MRGAGFFSPRPSAESFILDPVTLDYFQSGSEPYVIIDIRTPEEYDGPAIPAEFKVEHIEGSLNIPLGSILTSESAPLYVNFDAIDAKNKTAVFHCRSGRRTEENKAALRLWALENHFKGVRFMTGGIEQWKEWGFPTVTAPSAAPRM